MVENFQQTLQLNGIPLSVNVKGSLKSRCPKFEIENLLGYFGISSISVNLSTIHNYVKEELTNSRNQGWCGDGEKAESFGETLEIS